MAFASSRLGAQEAILKQCDLCEDDENVFWFCKDCGQNMCDRCKRMHLKTVICKNHQLVSILEGVAITKKNVSNVCQDHDEHFTFFCRTCEENICSICLSLVHKKHDFVDLRNFHSELQSSLENVMKEKEKEQLKITANIDELEKYESERRDTLTKDLASIDDRIEDITKTVNEEGRELKETLKSTIGKQIQEVEQEKQNLEGRKSEYDETLRTVKQEIILQTISTFGQFVETSTSKLQSLKPMSYSTKTGIRFNTGRTNKNLIVAMIGKVCDQQDVIESHGKEENKVTIISSEFHTTEIHNLDVQTNCSSICTSLDGSIWIGGKGCVYRMNPACSEVIHQIHSGNDLNCNYIASLRSGDVVVSYGGSSLVDKFTSDGRRVEFTTLTGMYPHDIAVNKHDILVVGSARGQFLPISSIVICSNTGSQLNRITFGKELHVGGFCISNDGDYVISDERSSCLITLDRSGAVLKRIQISKPGLHRMACGRNGNILGLPLDINKKVYMVSDGRGNERSFTVECDVRIDDICIDRDNRVMFLVDKRKVIVSKDLD